jgi:hypothetical protein
MVFDSNDFGQLRISGTTKFYAGSTTGTARGDLILQNLTTTTANTPNITFLVGNANNALVQGVVAPSANGAGCCGSAMRATPVGGLGRS